MTPSAGLVEGMDSLSLIEYDQPRLLPPYPLPSLSLRLALDEGQPLLVLHPSLPLPTMTPPTSPTPQTPPPTRSVSNIERSERRKAQRALYGQTKKGQRCRPSSPITKAKRETMLLFWKLEREIGLQEALECCQEIGLVALMFFSELLFPYVPSSISFYVSLKLTYSQSFLSLIC